MIELKDDTHVGELCFKGLSGEYATPKGYFVCDENPEDFAAYEAAFTSYMDAIIRL